METQYGKKTIKLQVTRNRVPYFELKNKGDILNKIRSDMALYNEYLLNSGF